MKRILFINRSFWPDVEATGQFLADLCEELAKNYSVTVIAGRSYYMQERNFGLFRLSRKEELGRISIIRVRHTIFWKASLIGRIINWFSFCLCAFISAMRTKADIIICCSDPPFLGIMSMVISRLKRIPYIYNCRDLYPDVAWGLGKLDKKSPLSRLYDHLNKRALDSASMVVCLGSSMSSRIAEKGVAKNRLTIITDCVDTQKIKPVARTDNPLSDFYGVKNKFVIMHSGNIGLVGDFDSLLLALNVIDKKRTFCVLFVGEGIAKERLKRRAKALNLENVLFFSYQPKEILPFSLGLPDLHIISLRKGMSGAVVPSKIYAILAAGRPYLALTPQDCEAAVIAREFGAGLWADPEDRVGIARLIEWAIANPAELEQIGRRGRIIAETKFDKNIIIKEWIDLLGRQITYEKNI